MKSADINKDNTTLHDLGDDLKAYADVRLQIIRLNVTDKVAFALSNFITTSILLVFAFLTVLFIGLGTARWLSGILQNEMLGYFIVAGGYLCITLIVFMLVKGNLKTKIASRLIQDFSNDDNDEAA